VSTSRCFRWEATSVIADQRLVAIIRTASWPEAEARALALLGAGVRAVEIALTTPGAFRAVEAVVAAAPPGSVVGVGTVIDTAAAAEAARCGARFVVSPNFDEDVVRTAHRHGLAALPGCATPTEALAALEAGADLVKLFPAVTWTPRSIGAVLEALPQLPLVPTGGVGIDDAPDWIAAGAVAVGMGGGLSRGPLEQLAPRAAELLARLAPPPAAGKVAAGS
jgi:2-dehydro-3-deoxyphosphogluconate aldolase / (4S)-4-hydroxy-2-oxoglutarate aldolase